MFHVFIQVILFVVMWYVKIMYVMASSAFIYQVLVANFLSFSDVILYIKFTLQLVSFLLDDASFTQIYLLYCTYK